MTDPTDVLGLEPDDLDGHTIEELSDYLDHDRRPPDPSIERSPACQMALAALQRLRTIASTFLDDDGHPRPVTDENWIGTVLAALPLELRPGRSFPIPLSDPAVSAELTEGALRGMIRATGDSVPGVLVGTVRIEVPEPEAAEARLAVEVAVTHGTVIPATVHALQARLLAAISIHAPFAITAVDVTVVDLLLPRRA